MQQCRHSQHRPKQLKSLFSRDFQFLHFGFLSDGVTVNTIQPGLHGTARLLGLYDGDAAAIGGAVPANTIGDAGDFGRIAAFMCSEHAKFMTGVSVPIDGGAHAGLQ